MQKLLPNVTTFIMWQRLQKDKVSALDPSHRVWILYVQRTTSICGSCTQSADPVVP